MVLIGWVGPRKWALVLIGWVGPKVNGLDLGSWLSSIGWVKLIAGVERAVDIQGNQTFK